MSDVDHHTALLNLETAILDYIAARADTPNIVVGWCVQVAVIDPENPDQDLTQYWLIRPEGQPFHATLGILDNAKHNFQHPRTG